MTQESLTTWGRCEFKSSSGWPTLRTLKGHNPGRCTVLVKYSWARRKKKKTIKLLNNKYIFITADYCAKINKNADVIPNNENTVNPLS